MYFSIVSDRIVHSPILRIFSLNNIYCVLIKRRIITIIKSSRLDSRPNKIYYIFRCLCPQYSSILQITTAHEWSSFICFFCPVATIYYLNKKFMIGRNDHDISWKWLTTNNHNLEANVIDFFIDVLRTFKIAFIFLNNQILLFKTKK